MTARLLTRLVALAIGLAAATAAAPAQPGPILILVSLDGWRWDYLARADAPHLRSLAARGVRSEGLIPAFPTVTFPNHYTIVTGLRPDHHGIVSNTMIDRSIALVRFTMSSDTARDARWWGGEPIWTLAIRNGQKSASMFWPGSEAIHPTYWRPYDEAVSNADRVRQVLAWLALPDADRPSFITLYFSDVDTAAHDTGPDSADTFDAAARLDEMVGQLLAGITRAGLQDRTTVVVVSDHGLVRTHPDRVVLLDDYIARDDVDVLDVGAFVALNPGPATTIDALYDKLAGKHPTLSVYRKAALPAALGYGRHPRVPAIVGLVEPGWTATWRQSAARETAAGWASGRGAHGYDPRHRDMHGLFVAAGPRVARGVVRPPLANVHLYAFLCALLGLTPGPHDGDAAATAALIVR